MAAGNDVPFYGLTGWSQALVVGHQGYEKNRFGYQTSQVKMVIGWRNQSLSYNRPTPEGPKIGAFETKTKRFPFTHMGYFLLFWIWRTFSFSCQMGSDGLKSALESGNWLRWPYRSHGKKWGWGRFICLLGMRVQHLYSRVLTVKLQDVSKLQVERWWNHGVFSFFGFFKSLPGWWFHFFKRKFTPILVEMIQFDEHSFQMGWLKPPTSWSFYC